jgi:multiple sugar transport system ATP-binding protein
MGEIVLQDITKVYAESVKAVDSVSMTIRDGEFIVLVGPSGCGKSTLLRMLAGLETVTSGAIAIDGRDVTTLPPAERDIAMVFQNYALYPHMTVRKNLAYGLRVRRTPKTETDRRVSAVAGLLGLSDLLQRRPAALSGGQRQRVAMGRAIVREPVAYLMDEPLSNLDAKLRVAMRAELSRLHTRLGTTTVYVTHDQVEAMTLGQRVAVMRNGRVQQIDTAQRLYRDPVNLFVAAFLGSPSMNLVNAEIGPGQITFGEFSVPFDTASLPGSVRDRSVILGIRPETFEDVAFSDPDLPVIEIEVAVLEELGSNVHAIFPVAAPKIEVDEVREAFEDEDTAAMLAEDDNQSFFVAQLDARTGAKVNGRIRLTIDPARFHYFDPATGETLTGSHAQPARAAEATD